MKKDLYTAVRLHSMQSVFIQLDSCSIQQQAVIFTRPAWGRLEYTHTQTPTLTPSVLLAGLQTTVQDWPGRTQLWHVGVPPSGPMDSLHHRLANALVGNASDAAALEFGLTGPTLKFHCDCLVALTGETGWCSSSIAQQSAMTHVWCDCSM